MFKEILVIIDRKCYRIKSIGSVEFELNDIYFGSQADFIDFVNPNNEQTVRGLFDLKEDRLVCCWHERKTVKRPKRIAPTSDGFAVCNYKRLHGLMDKHKKNEYVALSGLWETVGYECEGKCLEMKKDKSDFFANRRLFFFQDGLYTMVETNNLAVKVVHKPYQFEPKQGKQAINFTDDDGKLIPAIMDLQGSRLLICWNRSGDTRPDQFRTKKGDGHTLIRLKRVDTVK